MAVAVQLFCIIVLLLLLAGSVILITKKLGKKGPVVLLTLVVILLAYFLGSGFVEARDVYIYDYRVAEDGSSITLDLMKESSAGYLREAKVHQQHGGMLYLRCYNAIGGVNGEIGARSIYEIPLDPETEVIAIYRGNNCYQAVLEKDAEGNWQRV